MKGQNCNSFKVVSIIDSVIYNDSITLKINSNVSSRNERMYQFKGENASLVLKSPCGRIAISKKKPKSESWSFITYVFHFDNQKVTTSSKGNGEYFHYLQEMFSANTKPNVPNILGIMGEEQAFPIDKKEFLLNDNQYFLIRYLYKGEEIIKKVRFKVDEIFLNKKELFNLQNENIDPEKVSQMKLFYYNSSDKNDIRETYICHLKLRFETNNEAIEELKKMMKN